MDLSGNSGVFTEWIVLADYAEVINGKAYIVGGGWEHLTVQELPTLHNFGIAIAVSVPWNECNQIHPNRIELAHEDGEIVFSVEGQIQVGRPPGIPLGSAQRVPIAINVSQQFLKLGTYTIKSFISDQNTNETRFNIIAGRPGIESVNSGKSGVS